MTLSEAIAASEYTDGKLAAATDGALEVVVSTDDEHPGQYDIAWWDSMGNRRSYADDLSVATIESAYPDLQWYPIREEGEWGDEVEARYAASRKEQA